MGTATFKKKPYLPGFAAAGEGDLFKILDTGWQSHLALDLGKTSDGIIVSIWADSLAADILRN